MRRPDTTILFLALVCALGVFVVPSQVFAQGGGRSTAVLNIEATGVDRDTAETLTSIVRSEAQQTLDYQLVNSTPINLSEVVLLLGCDASSVECLSLASDELSAGILIYGMITKEASAYRLKVEIFDAGQAKVTHRLQKTIGLEKDLLLTSRRELETFFKQLRDEKLAATLVITSNVRGAEVFLNDESFGTTPLDRGGIKPGSYKVEVKKEGFIPWTVELEFGPSDKVSLRAPLKKKPAETVVIKDPPKGNDPKGTGGDGKVGGDPNGVDTTVEIPTDDERSVNWGGWSLVSVGAMSLAGSGLTVYLMRQLSADLNAQLADGTLTPEAATTGNQRGENYEFAHKVLLGAGIGSLLVGSVWLISSDGAPKRRQTTFELRAAPNGVSGVVRW